MQHAGCPGACAGTILGGVTDTTARPEVMRELVAEYLRAMHLTYLGHVAHLSPGERGALPLHGHLTVVAAAAHNLHPDRHHTGGCGDGRRGGQHRRRSRRADVARRLPRPVGASCPRSRR